MAISKVQTKDGRVLMDLTQDTVTPEELAEGATAHDKAGARIVGRLGVPAYVQEEASRASRVVTGHQNENTFSILACSDIHARLGFKSGSYSTDQMLASTTHAAQGMDLIRKTCHMDYACNLGDTLWDGPARHNAAETPEQALDMYRLAHKLISPAFLGLPQCWLTGNHDQLDEGGAISPGRLTPSQVYPMIGAWCTGERPEVNKVAGYGYQDFPEAQLRLVYCNTTEVDNRVAISRDQLTWLEQVLNVEDKKGWQTVILSHTPMDQYGGDAPVMGIIKAAKNVLCNIHGHTHNYLVGVLTGTKIPRIAIPNVDFYRTNEYGKNDVRETKDGIEYGTVKSWDKVSGTKDDTAFCVVSIDRKTNKLYADHYGAGEDRIVDLPAWEDPSQPKMVNLVPGSIDTNKQPFNGTGWKNRSYLSSSGAVSDAPGESKVTTGFMPLKPGPHTIRIGGSAKKTTSEYGCRIAFYDSSFAKKGDVFKEGKYGSSVYYGEVISEDNTALTWKTNDQMPSAITASYFRVSWATDALDAGDKLIATVDQPIE